MNHESVYKQPNKNAPLSKRSGSIIPERIADARKKRIADARQERTANALPERITDVFIVLMTTVFLCAFGTKGYLNIVQIKYALFCALTGAYVLIAGALAAYLKLNGRLRAGKTIGADIKYSANKTISADIKYSANIKTIGRAQFFIALYAFFSVISFILSDYKAGSLVGMSRYEGLITILLYCAAALLVSLFAVPKKLYLYSFGAGISVCAAVSILQLFGSNPFGLYPAGMNYYDKGVLYPGAYLGTAGNTDLLSGIVAIAIPLFCYYAIKSKGYEKLFYVTISVLSLIVFAGMRVSGCTLGVVLGIALCAPFLLQKKTRNRILVAECICALIIIAACTYIYRFGLSFAGISIPEHFKIPDSGRLYIWKNVLLLIKDKPLFGHGPDTLSAVMTAHFERLDPLTHTLITASIDVAHNEYLNVWVNQGLFAMLSFIGIIVSTLTSKVSGPNKTLILILKCALLCYAIQAFFEFSMIINAPFFWILIGLISSFSRTPETMRA